MAARKLIKPLVALILLIFFANFLANMFYWYSSVWYFDIFMHFLGGAWTGLAVLYLVGPRFLTPKSAIGVLAGVLVVGIGWELFELSVDAAIAENPFNFLDAVSDILFDLAGGCAALFYYLKKSMSQALSGIR